MFTRLPILSETAMEVALDRVFQETEGLVRQGFRLDALSSCIEQ